jgi:hypothetical protein
MPLKNNYKLMKKIIQNTFIVLMLMAAVPLQMNANDAIESKNATESAEAKVLIARLEVINALDKTTMKRSEKKALRKEVKSINNNLADLNGGVYLTTGAIIIIILLLILIL